MIDSTTIDDPQDMLPAEINQDAKFRREHPIMWWTTLVGPCFLSLLILVMVWQSSGSAFVWRLLTTAVATLFFFGKFVILGGTEGGHESIHSFLTTEQLFVMVLYMDLVTACVLTFHLGFAFKLAVIGPKLEAVVQDGQFIMQSNPWMKRVTFVGLVVFVMFPLAATGSVGASIFGRLLGMSRLLTLVGILLGSILGCSAAYFGAEFINQHFDRNNPWNLIGGIALLVSIILILSYRYRQLKSRYLASQTTNASSNQNE